MTFTKSETCRQPESAHVGEGGDDNDGDASTTFMAELEGPTLTAAAKREIPAAAADKRRTNEEMMGEREQFAPIGEEEGGPRGVLGE